MKALLKAKHPWGSEGEGPAPLRRVSVAEHRLTEFGGRWATCSPASFPATLVVECRRVYSVPVRPGMVRLGLWHWR